MNAVAQRVRRASIVEQRFPNRADAIALLFPLKFDGVPITADYEISLLRVLNTEAGSMLYKSSTLQAGYQRLVRQWAERSGLERREGILRLMLTHDVPALELALDTVRNSDDPHTLAVALQAIARYGNHRHAHDVINLLEDDRVIDDNGFIRGKVSQTRLGDAAMATLALLYDITLDDAGFDGVTQDPKSGFQLQEIGFEIDDKSRRQETRKKIVAKVAEITNDARKPEPVQLRVE